MSEKIKWAICDDAEYLCYSIKVDLSEFERLLFVGSANDSKSCIQFLKDEKIDVLLLDIQMETTTAGIDIIKKLKETSPKTKIIMLTSYDYDDYIFSAYANGADDYIIKTMKAEDMAEAIVKVYESKSILRPEIAQKLIQYTRDIRETQHSLIYMLEIMTRLSPSEFEILKDAYNGDSYKVIAARRFVDISTVKSHASRIIRKFDAVNMSSLIEELKPLKIFDLFQEKI